MKKILATVLQIAVTIAVLYWVFHDPQKRAQMGIALRTADYRWILIALLAYTTVEIAAGVRWWILLNSDVDRDAPALVSILCHAGSKLLLRRP